MSEKDGKEERTAKSEEESKGGKEGLQKLLKDLGFIGAWKIISALTGFLMVPILTKALGPENYGLWALVSVTYALFSIILLMGSPFSIARLFPEKNDEERGRDLSSVLVVVTLSLGIFGAVILLFPSILADTVFEGRTSVVKIVVFILISGSFKGLFMSVFRALREMKKFSVISIVEDIMKTSGFIIIILLGHGLIGILGVSLLVYTIFSIVLLYMVKDKIKLRRPKTKSIKEYFSLGIPTIPSGISEVIVITSDKYLIAMILGATSVGYYAPAYNLGEMFPKFVTGMLGLVLLPTLAKHYEDGNTSQVEDMMHLCIKYFILFSLPLIVVFALIGRNFLATFTTPEIAANASIILVLSSIVGLLMGLEIIFQQSISLKKDTKLIGMMWSIAAVLNVVGNIIFIPRYGILAAGLTSIASYLFLVLFTIFYTMKHLYFPIDLRMIGKITLSVGLMGITLGLIDNYVWQNLPFLILVGIVSYFAYLYITKTLTTREVTFIKNTFAP